MESSPRDFVYYRNDSLKRRALASMRAYIKNKPEMDKTLERLITPYLAKGNPKVLDACCGIGHLTISLAQKFPNATFIGIDQTPFLINEAKRLSRGLENVDFRNENIYGFSEKYPKSFDISINWKTISWLPYYEDIMRELFGATKKAIFLSSLFYNGNIEFITKVREWAISPSPNQKGFDFYYNTYSLPKFMRFCKKNKARKIKVHPFEIGIDLPRSNLDRMGTYTMKLIDGERLQVSGCLVMNWKILEILL